jgi:hypothetical protein
LELNNWPKMFGWFSSETEEEKYLNGLSETIEKHEELKSFSEEDNKKMREFVTTEPTEEFINCKIKK